MVRAVIFDLDSCLAAADEAGEELYAPAFAAIRAANDGRVPEERLRAAFAESWRIPFDVIAETYGFSPEMRRAGFEAFRRTEVTTPMRGYGDLDVLTELAALRFLVTSGFRRLQESKIRALGIASLFAGIHIDALDEPGPRGKRRAFEAILAAHRLAPAEVVVVGDNPDSELAEGRRLGMVTVQILRPGVPPSPAADHRIDSLHGLKPLLK